MNHYLSFCFLFICFTSNSQITDTCEYVSQNYDFGGLDCAWGVTNSNFPIDSYQWVNCDSLYAPFPGDTSSFYSSIYDGNVAVIIEAWGCIDTSFCHDICTWGIEEVANSEKELEKVLDLTGKEVGNGSNIILIYVYSDGTREKVFKIN